MAWLQPRFEAAVALLEPGLNLYSNAIEEQLRGITRRISATKQTLGNPEENRPATHAYVFANEKGTLVFRQRPLTMFKRMLEEELAKGNDKPEFVEMQAEAAVQLEETCRQLESTIEYKNIPIRSLATVQAFAGLATAAYVRDKIKALHLYIQANKINLAAGWAISRGYSARFRAGLIQILLLELI